MYVMTNKPEMGGRFYESLIRISSCPEQGTDMTMVMQQMAGVLVETCLVFDAPDQAMQASFAKMCAALDTEIDARKVTGDETVPAHEIDLQVERGRNAARIFFEDWMDCMFEFHELVTSVFTTAIIGWEQNGVPREESLSMLYECTRLGMAFEFSAQELCDIVIEKHVANHGWSLGDCIGALSAVAGRRLAQSLNENTCMIFKGSDLPANLDSIVYVMTKEAIRLGVPAGSDWRFGLAANDMPVNAPVELIQGLEPYCEGFFDAIALLNPFEQAVACAKAAGRMVAVASGGELPEIEPAIAKPLAMSAMTESYKFVCLDYKIAQI